MLRQSRRHCGKPAHVPHRVPMVTFPVSKKSLIVLAGDFVTALD